MSDARRPPGPPRGQTDAQVLAMAASDPKPSQRQIADALGITVARVSWILRRAGVSARPARAGWSPAIAARRARRDERKDRARELVAGGMSRQKAADALGVHVQTVYKYVGTKDL